MAPTKAPLFVRPNSTSWNNSATRRYQSIGLVTNDSDLAEPVRIVTKELGMPVGILNPHEPHSVTLKPLATFVKRIRQSHLIASQFPPALVDRRGSFPTELLVIATHPEK
jgi:hypothetical protein